MKPDDRLRLRESWIACFFLGVIMLNFPFLEIVNKDYHLFGVPLLVLYFLVGWPLSIVVIYLFTHFLQIDESPADGGADSASKTRDNLPR